MPDRAKCFDIRTQAQTYIMADNNAANANANLWEGNALKDAFARLGLTDVAAREFMENGVTDVHQRRSLSSEALGRLIKLIQ